MPSSGPNPIGTYGYDLGGSAVSWTVSGSKVSCDMRRVASLKEPMHAQKAAQSEPRRLKSNRPAWTGSAARWSAWSRSLYSQNVGSQRFTA